MEIERNCRYLLNTLIGGLDKSSPDIQCGFDESNSCSKRRFDRSRPYKSCGFDKSCPWIMNRPHLLMDVFKRKGKKIVFFLILSVVLSSNAFSEVKRNRTSIGFLIGDPMALSLRLPLTQKSCLNISGGIWAWHFWEDPHYNTGVLTADFAWMFSKKNSRWNYFLGIGLNIFFADNPKDSRDYDACLGIRFPLGIEFLASDHVSIGIECAPFFQIMPPFAFRPYVIDQNAGIVLRFFL